MSVRVRLTRVGSKKNPIWRVVVADQRSPRDGRFIEAVGQYNPQTDPSTIVLDRERLDHWLGRGAQASNTVKQLMKAHSKGLTPATAGAAAPSEEADATEDEAAATPAEGAALEGGGESAEPLEGDPAEPSQVEPEDAESGEEPAS